jgi:hypothetical protein
MSDAKRHRRSKDEQDRILSMVFEMTFPASDPPIDVIPDLVATPKSGPACGASGMIVILETLSSFVDGPIKVPRSGASSCSFR